MKQALERSSRDKPTKREIALAFDGERGLYLAKKLRPKLIILNATLPKRSGILVLETLRLTETNPTRIVMIASNEGTRRRQYAEALGVDAYLCKPFAMRELLDVVERAFDAIDDENATVAQGENA